MWKTDPLLRARTAAQRGVRERANYERERGMTMVAFTVPGRTYEAIATYLDEALPHVRVETRGSRYALDVSEADARKILAEIRFWLDGCRNGGVDREFATYYGAALRASVARLDALLRP